MNKAIKRATSLTALFSLGFIIHSLYGIDTFFADKVNIENVSWLDNVDDNKLIKELYLPGTHNSGARFSFLDISWKCQDLSIKSQLTLGARFLDVRLKNDSTGLKVIHGIADQKLTFKKLLSQCYEFLDKYESEFIFMSVKEEEKGNSKLAFEERLKREINNNYFLENTTLPEKVKDVRGKIVLFSRYSDPTIGVNCSSGWKDSVTEETNSFTLEKNNIFVQDYYKVTTLDNKKDEIKKAYAYTGANLNLNFTSGYYVNGFPPSSAFALAKEINTWLVADLFKTNPQGGQIFVSDFITDTLVNSIIDLNELENKE